MAASKKIKIEAVGKHDARSNSLVNFDEGTHDGIISQIFLTHGTSGIMSIQFQFMLNGFLYLSDHHGPSPTTANMFDVIELNIPHEYITGVSGEYHSHEGSAPHIQCLKFTTNTSDYGPFGTWNPRTNTSDYGPFGTRNPSTNTNEKFAFKMGKSSQFGGFHGAYDDSGLHYVGVYLQPKTNPHLGLTMT